MASYVVMEPPQADSDAVLVRDGFYFLAFLLPFLWFLWHRMWVEAGIALVVAILLGFVPVLGPASGMLGLLVGLYVGLDAAALRIAALRRRGWREWGVVEAANPADAELRYFAELGETPVRENPSPKPPGGPWGGPRIGARKAHPGSLDLIGVTGNR